MTESTDLTDVRARRDAALLRATSVPTISTGTSWLVFGGVVAVVSLVLLASLITMRGAGDIALAGVITVVMLYLGMIAARIGLPAGPRRLGSLGAGMLLIAGVSLVSVVIAVAGAWSTFRV